MATVLERIPGPRPPWTAAAMRAANNLAPAARHAWLNAQFSPPAGMKWTHAMLCPIVNQLITHRGVLLKARPQLRALWQEVCPYDDPGATAGDWRSLAATERMIHLHTGAFDCRSDGQMIEKWVADGIRPAFPVPQLPGTVMKPLTVLPVVDVFTGAVCDNCEACVRFLVDFYRRPGPARAEMGNLYSVYGQSLVAWAIQEECSEGVLDALISWMHPGRVFQQIGYASHPPGSIIRPGTGFYLPHGKQIFEVAYDRTVSKWLDDEVPEAELRREASNMIRLFRRLVTPDSNWPGWQQWFSDRVYWEIEAQTDPRIIWFLLAYGDQQIFSALQMTTVLYCTAVRSVNELHPRWGASLNIWHAWAINRRNLTKAWSTYYREREGLDWGRNNPPDDVVLPNDRNYRYFTPDEAYPEVMCTPLMIAAQLGNTAFFGHLLGLAQFGMDVGQHAHDWRHFTTVHYALRCRNTVAACVMVAKMLRFIPMDGHRRWAPPGSPERPYTSLERIHGYVLFVMNLLHFRLLELHETFRIGGIGPRRYLHKLLAECRHHQLLIRQVYLYMAPAQSAAYFAGPRHAMVLGRAVGLGGHALNLVSVFDDTNFRMPLTTWRDSGPHIARRPRWPRSPDDI